MATQDDRISLLQGTLDLLILRTLIFGPQHGQGVARAIQQQSEDVLIVDTEHFIPRSKGSKVRVGLRPSGACRKITDARDFTSSARQGESSSQRKRANGAGWLPL